ncbi:tyrosine-type recombinase/integrase [Siminovitchia sp. FSL H7-0308]|nr:tyrosine-type recombinase/integrase [Siminovitchia thermophila]ONK24372.1 integrase [Bacillus sp. VT-16-64]
MRKRNVRRATESLDDLFDIFIAIKDAEGRAPSTMQQYRENYGFFTEYLDKHGIKRTPSAITRDTIRDYIVFMRNDWIRFEGHSFKTEVEQTAGLAPATINTRLKTLRVMYRCLMDEALVDSNPMEGVRNLPEQQENIEVLTAEELQRLLNVPNRRSYADFRDYVLMNLLIDGMMRISEAINLKVDDFNLSGQSVVIRAAIAKNRKTRTIPIESRTARLINELIIENKADFDSDYIFLTVYGGPISRDHFRKRLNDFAEKAGIKKNVHPHLFRHTAATMFLEAGGDIRHLQMLLGHSDLRVLLRYTHLSNEALKQQHEQYSPIKQVLGKRNLPRKIKRKTQ